MKQQTIRSEYLELLKKSLIDYKNIGTEELYPLHHLPSNWKIRLLTFLDQLLRKRNFGLYKIKMIDAENRINGYDWPANAITMVGLNRLNNVEFCVNTILDNHIAGDFVETGVWRGGVIILIIAILEEMKVNDRKVWAFDSFSGLPEPDPVNYPDDAGNNLQKMKILSASLEEVKRNFEIYGISTEKVNFRKGWFKNTLPENEIKEIALLRLDGDLYESTILALEHLYPKLTPGGFVIIDDYNAFPNCKKAVDQYRKNNGLTEPVTEIDREAIYWQKTW